MTIDPKTVRSALAVACRAPSVHNSQPWRWRIGDSSAHLGPGARPATTASRRIGWAPAPPLAPTPRRSIDEVWVPLDPDRAPGTTGRP
jgi:hypothetical protein